MLSQTNAPIVKQCISEDSTAHVRPNYDESEVYMHDSAVPVQQGAEEHAVPIGVALPPAEHGVPRGAPVFALDLTAGCIVAFPGHYHPFRTQCPLRYVLFHIVICMKKLCSREGVMPASRHAVVPPVVLRFEQRPAARDLATVTPRKAPSGATG